MLGSSQNSSPILEDHRATNIVPFLHASVGDLEASKNLKMVLDRTPSLSEDSYQCKAFKAIDVLRQISVDYGTAEPRVRV